MKLETPNAPGEASFDAAQSVLIVDVEAAAAHLRANFPFSDYSAAVVIGRDANLRTTDTKCLIRLSKEESESPESFAAWLKRSHFAYTGDVQEFDAPALLKAIDASEEVLPPPPDAAESSGLRPFPSLVDAAEALSSPLEFPHVLFEGLLHRGSKLLLGGGSKSYKTWSLINLATSVVAGIDWWGFPCVKGKVCYVNFELQDTFLFKRIGEVAKALGVDIESGQFSVWNLRGYASSSPEFVARLIVVLKAKGFALIILDPVYKMANGLKENAAEDMAKLMNDIERIAVETGAAIAIGAHFSKGNQSEKNALDRISGSGVFGRDPDTILTMTEHESLDCFTIESIVRNFSPVQAFVVHHEHPLMIRDAELDPVALKPARRQGARKEPRSAADLKALVPMTGSIPKNTLLGNAKDSGIADRRGRGLLDQLLDDQELYEWRFSRSGTNPQIQISRQKQTLL